jgi:hypothetical protein
MLVNTRPTLWLLAATKEGNVELFTSVSSENNRTLLPIFGRCKPGFRSIELRN